jgi:hypothetical protein
MKNNKSIFGSATESQVLDQFCHLHMLAEYGAVKDT